MTLVHGLLRLGAAVPSVAAVVLSGSIALASSGGPDIPTNVKDGGATPSGAVQSASWSAAQTHIYAQKLQGLSLVASTSGRRASQAFSPTTASRTTMALCPLTVGAATCSPPVSKSISIYNDPEPNSYYGYQCGPAAGHNALGAYGVNVPIGAGYYPYASGLTQEMHTTSNGTDRTNMPNPLNSHQSQNVYSWQTLGTPAGATNGTTDLINYTVDDIWYNDSPIYNIKTYGWDPIRGQWRYPFAQYYGVVIYHYIAAYGYTNNGAYIQISDSAVKGSHTGSQRYTQYYEDVWAAIHNHPAVDAILW